MINVNFDIGSRYPVNRRLLRQAARELLVDRGLDNAEVEISIVGQRKMTHLNEEIVGHKGVTDVLSFPQHERDQLDDFPLPEGAPTRLGLIMICYPVAVDQARKRGKLVDDQLRFYLEHGLMHLLGFHHNDGMSDFV